MCMVGAFQGFIKNCAGGRRGGGFVEGWIGKDAILGKKGMLAMVSMYGVNEIEMGSGSVSASKRVGRYGARSGTLV